jgi:hypothetical protein
MVTSKRVEQKLPLLITDGPWWTFEIDRNEYRLRQFKKREPTKYQQHRNQIITDLEKLKRDVDAILNGRAL